MRWFPFSTFALLFCAMSALPFAAQANSANAVKLARIEAQGLASAGDARLKSMISAAKLEIGTTNTGDVQFTRKWIDAQPRANGTSEWRCLAEALYFEARGETVKGQFAVAEVIMNRVKSTRFPGSLCAVINQGTGKKYQCQFTYTCDGHKEVVAEPAAFARVGKVARAIIDGRAPRLTGGATHYHTTAVSPRWSRVFTRTARIGVHLFYRKG
ncbi:MAG: cell wall hydrolase [Sulfitobacter sp.]